MVQQDAGEMQVCSGVALEPLGTCETRDCIRGCTRHAPLVVMTGKEWSGYKSPGETLRETLRVRRAKQIRCFIMDIGPLCGECPILEQIDLFLVSLPESVRTQRRSVEEAGWLIFVTVSLKQSIRGGERRWPRAPDFGGVAPILPYDKGMSLTREGNKRIV